LKELKTKTSVPGATFLFTLLISSFVLFSWTEFGRQYSPEIMAALQSVQYIAQHIKDEDKDNEVISTLHYAVFIIYQLHLIYPHSRYERKTKGTNISN